MDDSNNKKQYNVVDNFTHEDLGAFYGYSFIDIRQQISSINHPDITITEIIK
jgi:hypothetical protein